MSHTETISHTALLVKMVLDRWYGSIKNFDKITGAISDEALLKEIAPGKNRGIYLLGHLIAVHDDMLVLLDMGERQYPALQVPFLQEADNKSVAGIPSAAEVRSIWATQCEALKQQFDSLPPDAWFDKHTAVSAADFAREPHRNKLNIIITRTSHLQYHSGQLVLLTQ